MIRKTILHTAPRMSASAVPASYTHIGVIPTFRYRVSRPTIKHHDSIVSAPKYFASHPSADEVMEGLQELYATAKDEFELAVEETEKKTVYASEDRQAAKEALTYLKDAYEEAVKRSSPPVANEIRGRVSQRIRELDNACTALEEAAQED